jgi:hypothetical protein
MSEPKHPSMADWLDLLRDRLPPERRRALREHRRRGCARCDEARAWAEHVLAAGEIRFDEPPAAALSAARALFRKHRSRSFGDRVHTLAARLLSPSGPALAGAREGAGPGLPRTWEAGPYLVEVMIDPAPRRRRTTLRCRVVTSDQGLGVPGVARLLRDGRPRAECRVDDLGEAILRDVVVTDGALELLLEGDRIALEL